MNAATHQTENKRVRKTNWGPWVYDEDTFTLNYTEAGVSGAIDLGRCTDSASMLDWVFQAHLHFEDGENMFYLLWALDEVLNLGHVAAQNRRINPRKVAEMNGYRIAPLPNDEWF